MRVYLLLLGAVVAALGWSCARAAAGDAEGQVQPIAFSHQAHAAAELDCSRCHRGAEKGAEAGLVAVRTCASCHRRIIPDHPEVQKVLTAFEEGKSIEWKKINHLPAKSMVHFHHGVHTQAGVACSECHGDVASMTVAEPVLEVADMGWCIDCHRAREASVDCLACHY
ncbi:MAG: cytochrome c3 family protein [Acidobacteriota bacterium]